MLISTFYFPFFSSIALYMVMILFPQHHSFHQVPSHLLLQLNHWSLGDARAALGAAEKWENMLYSPFCAAVQTVLRYSKGQSLWWKGYFSLYLYFIVSASNSNSRNDLTGTQIRVLDPNPDQNFLSLLEMKRFFHSRAWDTCVLFPVGWFFSQEVFQSSNGRARSSVHQSCPIYIKGE